jgi:hypothetical protein
MGMGAMTKKQKKDQRQVIPENNAITALVAGLSIQEVGTESNVKKNAATHVFSNSKCH